MKEKTLNLLKKYKKELVCSTAIFAVAYALGQRYAINNFKVELRIAPLPKEN